MVFRPSLLFATETTEVSRRFPLRATWTHQIIPFGAVHKNTHGFYVDGRVFFTKRVKAYFLHFHKRKSTNVLKRTTFIREFSEIQRLIDRKNIFPTKEHKNIREYCTFLKKKVIV